MPRYHARLLTIVLVALGVIAAGELRCEGEPPPPAVPPVPFDGERALRDAGEMVAIGPRPSGSPNALLTQNLIIRRIEETGLVVRQDAFTANSPQGEISMKNIVGVLEGERGGVIVLGAHFDTKRFEGDKFVGANDGAAGSGFLLELARTLASRGKPTYTYWFVFFDGEEAIGEWSDNDGIYGSRHFVKTLRDQELLNNVRTMILFDLIGDSDLTVQKESNSYSTYRELFWEEAKKLGYGEYFLSDYVTVTDDHVPFVRAGIRSVNLIDFMYGDREVPGKYWHTNQDTMDKISAKSLQIVGDVVLAALPRIERLIHVVETRSGYAPLPAEEDLLVGAPVAGDGDAVGAVLGSDEDLAHPPIPTNAEAPDKAETRTPEAPEGAGSEEETPPEAAAPKEADSETSDGTPAEGDAEPPAGAEVPPETKSGDGKGGNVDTPAPDPSLEPDGQAPAPAEPPNSPPEE